MNKYNNTRPPRTGVIVLASVIFLSIMVIATLNAYEKEAQALGYAVKMSPASVSYGTVSTARTSTPVVVPMQHTSPMMSRGISYSNAYSSYTAMSKGSSSGAGLKVYTTSSVSAPVYSNGGSNAGGGSMGSTGASSSSHRGTTRYGGVSVTMPVLAMNSSLLATSASAAEISSPGISGPRRVKPTGSGEDGEWRYGGDDPENPSDWWYYDEWEGDWIPPKDGDPRTDGAGNNYVYVGTYPDGSWVLVGDQGDPTNPQPLGATPWLLMLLLLVAYAGVKALRMQRQK